MKSTTQSSVSHGRYGCRGLLAATAALLASAAFLSAQTGAAGSSSSGSSPKNPSYGSSSDTHRGTHKPSDSSSSSATGTSATDSSSSAKTGTSSSDINATSATSATSGSATGAGQMTGRATASEKLSWGDRRFVTKAADSGQDEVSLAKLAAEKASNAEVKTFAQKLADAHQQVVSELQTLASQKNVNLDHDNDRDRAYKRLSKKTGAEFDHEFVEHMIDEHEKDIKMFEKAAKDAKDSDIRSFAAKTVDHLRDHLRQAESLRQTIMPTGRSDSAAGTTRSSSSSYDTSSATSTPGTSSSSSDAPRPETSTGRDATSSSSATDTTGSTTPPRDSSR